MSSAPEHQETICEEEEEEDDDDDDDDDDDKAIAHHDYDDCNCNVNVGGGPELGATPDVYVKCMERCRARVVHIFKSVQNAQ